MSATEIEEGEIIEDEDIFNEIDQCQNTVIPYDPSDSLLRLHSMDSSSSSKYFFPDECPSPSLSECMSFEEHNADDLDELELRKLALGSMVDNVGIKTSTRKNNSSKSSSRKRRKSSSFAKQRRECQMQIQNLHSMQEKALSLEDTPPHKSNSIDKQIELTFGSWGQQFDLPKDNYETVAMELGSSDEDDTEKTTTTPHLTAFDEENVSQSIICELSAQVSSSLIDKPGETGTLLELKCVDSDPMEVNDIDLELLRQKALETLFKSSLHNDPQPQLSVVQQEILTTSNQDLIIPPSKQVAGSYGRPSPKKSPKIALPIEASVDRYKNKLPPLMNIAPELPPPMNIAPELPPLMNIAPELPPLMNIASELPPLMNIATELPPLMNVAPEELPPKVVKPAVYAPARRKPFIIELGESSSDEESNRNKEYVPANNKQMKFVTDNRINYSTKVIESRKKSVVNNLTKVTVPKTADSSGNTTQQPVSASKKLATIHKEMLRRKDHYLQSKLALYKMKESLAKKKESRHQILTDMKTLRRKLKLLTSKCKTYNQDITTEEKKLKTLEHEFNNEEKNFSTYCDMVRSYIKKKKGPPKSKIKLGEECYLVELLGRASVSCLHHFLYQIDFDYVLSASSDNGSSSSSSQPVANSSIIHSNKTSPESIIHSQNSSKHCENMTSTTDHSVECKESLIAKSIVSHLRNLSDNNAATDLINGELHGKTSAGSHSQPALSSVIINEALSEMSRSSVSSNSNDIENKDQSKLMTNYSKQPLTDSNREPLKDSQNPILITQRRKSTTQSDIMAKKSTTQSDMTKKVFTEPLKVKPQLKANIEVKGKDFSIFDYSQADGNYTLDLKKHINPTVINSEVDRAFERLSCSTVVKTPRDAINVNAIVCPFGIDGVCLDKDCEFQHPEYLKNESQFEKASSNIVEQDLKSNESLFDPVLFQMNQPLKLVSHLDCKLCSMRVAISTHHLIDDPECSSCLQSLEYSNYCMDEFVNLLHHLQFRIHRKTLRGEDTANISSYIIAACEKYQSKAISLPDNVLKHCLVNFSVKPTDFAPACLNLLKSHDFPPEVCLFAIDLCKDYPSKKEIAMQSLLYSKSTENTEILNHLLLIYCRLEYMAGRTKQAQSFLLDSIKGFSNCSPTSDQISDLYFTVRLYLDWILLDYLPYSFQNYRPFFKKTILLHEETIMFLFNCLFPGIFQNPIKTLLAVNSLSFTPHLVYLFHIFIDFLSVKGKNETVLNVTANLISAFGLKSFLFSFCHTAFKKSPEFSLTTFLEKYFIKREIIEKLYPALVYLNAVLFIKSKQIDKSILILESFSKWLFNDQCHSIRPYCLYKYALQIDESFLFHPLLKPKFQPSHPAFRKSLNYMWLNYALYGCLLGLHEDISYQLHKVCALHLLPHDDLHMVVHFLLRLLASTVCKVQPLYYCKLTEKLCFYAVPDELESCSEYFNVEIAELVQQIKLNELTFSQRNEFCTNLIEKHSFNLALLMSLVKSLIAGSNSQDHYLAFSLCQAASFDNPKYEEFWLLYLEMIKLNKLSDEVVNLMLSQSVKCLPESQRLWKAYYCFSVRSRKPKLQKSLKIEMKKTGLFS